MDGAMAQAACRLVGSLAAETLREAAQAPNTRIAYEKGWRCFAGYCQERGIDPLDAAPADLVDFFVTGATQPSSAGGKPLSLGTLAMYRSAINRRYIEDKLPSPAASEDVAAAFRALARLLGSAPRQVKALREHHILRMLDVCGDSAIGLRNASVLAVGFAAALRRSEICALQVDDVETVGASRMVVHIRRSKTDQAGNGQSVAVPDGRRIRPVSRLRAWLEHAKFRDGHLFQTMKRGGRPTGRPLHHSDIARLVKHYVNAIGLDPSDYSAHSLRAGFVTSAAVHHARLDKIMEVTRHKSPAMVLKYIRDADSFKDHAGAGFL